MYVRTGVTKQLKSRAVSSQHPGCDGSAVHPHSKSQIQQSRSQRSSQPHLLLLPCFHHIPGKFGHAQGMVVAGGGQSSDGHVTIANGFNFEDPPALGQVVKGPIQTLQHGKDIDGGATGRPSCKAGNV